MGTHVTAHCNTALTRHKNTNIQQCNIEFSLNNLLHHYYFFLKGQYCQRGIIVETANARF